MSEPILELPGITVTRESIEMEGREVAVKMIKGTCVKEKGSAFSAFCLRVFKAALVASMGWFGVTMVLATLVVLQGYLAYPTWLGDFLVWVDNILGPATSWIVVGALLVALLTILPWFALRKRRYFMVQLQTKEGTLTAYKTRDKEQAEQVLKAVELAMDDATPPQLP